MINIIYQVQILLHNCHRHGNIGSSGINGGGTTTGRGRGVAVLIRHSRFLDELDAVGDGFAVARIIRVIIIMLSLRLGGSGLVGAGLRERREHDQAEHCLTEALEQGHGGQASVFVGAAVAS